MISPVNGIDIIFEQARELGFRQIQVGKVLELFSQVGQNINTEISLKDLFLINFANEINRRYDIIVRYLAIEEYYNQNNYGFNLYKKMQSLRMNNKSYGELAETQFRKLIDSYEKYGYDKESRIDVLSNLKLFDGSHRIALGLYHSLDNISVQILPKTEDIDFGLKWFKSVGFTEEEINIIKSKGDELYQNWKTVQFTGMFLGSALNFAASALDDLKQYGVVTDVVYHKYKREEYNNVIKKIYSIDDVASWKISKKIYYLNNYPSEIISFHLQIEPDYRVKQMSNLPLSTKGEKIKNIIRSKYQTKLDDYYFDIIFHMADNSYQSDFINMVLSPNIDLANILSKITDFHYVLLGTNVPYMPKDFPKSIPVGKDIDVIVLPSEYTALVEQLTEATHLYNKHYEIRCIEKSNTNTQIRYEKFNRLVFLLDIFGNIEELNNKFITDSINARVKLKNYFITNDFYEYLYRLVKFYKNKNKWWHYKYLYEHQAVYDEQKALKYCKIKLRDVI